MDLHELLALQEAQGTDPLGRELTLVVPARDPEFGPYSGYAFCAPGGGVPAGYRVLTQDEVLSALADADYERES